MLKSVVLNTGLAVSGGVDSMALARLSRDFRPTSRLEEIEFRPFVVDHKARPESTEEAREVVAALKTLGISAFLETTPRHFLRVRRIKLLIRSRILENEDSHSPVAR